MVQARDRPRAPGLALPARWVEELDELRRSKAATAVGSIALSCDRRRDWGADLDDVATDLSAGMAIFRVPGDSPRYDLVGNGFTLRLLSKPARAAGTPMALVREIQRAVRMPPRDGRFACTVRFCDPWEEEPCDLTRLWELLGAERSAARRTAAQNALKRDRHGQGRAGPRPLDPFVWVRRRYGTMLELLDLLRLRAEHEVIETGGEVVGAGGGLGSRSNQHTLALRVAAHAREFDDARVAVTTANGESWETRVREVHRDLVVLEHGPSRPLPAGPVTIARASRFGMRQHKLALERFINGDVVGDWFDLADLLCNTKALDRPDAPPPPAYFCDTDPDPDSPPLNRQQRAAVAGALASPHGFFIQGPPGTGKTSVICELARQLIARRERVLLLAPTHVALDEALRRVGDKPGVRALRLSWNELKVDEDLRRFLPDRISAQRHLRVRPREASRAEQWGRERDLLTGELAATEALRAALAWLDDLREEVTRAERRLTEAERQRSAWRASHDQELAALRLQVAELGPTIATAPAERARLQERWSRAQAVMDGLAGPLRQLAAASHVVERSRRAHVAVRHELAALEDELRSATERASATRAAFQRELAVVQQRRQEAADAVTAAQQFVAHTTRQLEAMRRQRAVVGRVLDVVTQRPNPEADRWRGERSNAQRVWVAWYARWEELERQHTMLLERQQSLERTWLAPFAQREAAREREERAAADERRRLDAWRHALEAAGGRVDGQLPVVDGIGRLLEMVLRDALAADPLPAWLNLAAAAEAQRALKEIQRRLAHLDALAERHAAAEQQLALLEATAAAEHASHEQALAAAGQALAAAQAELERQAGVVENTRAALSRDAPESAEQLSAYADRLRRRLAILEHLPVLERRWFDLTAGATDQEIAADLEVAFARSANLVCATTTGIVAKGSDVVRYADFDTLIVDEASRVTDNEFLIGAIRARRWVLVGDEHQLPPYVDPLDERHLHALAALHRAERGQASSLEEAVAQLAELWKEDKELRQFRQREVREHATGLRDSGDWERLYGASFRAARRAAHRSENSDGGEEDPDRRLLRTMLDYLVHSFFERGVGKCRRSLRETLIVQRRMVKPVADLVCGPVYGGNFVTPDAEDLASHGVLPLVAGKFTAPVVLLDTSAYNQRANERNAGTGFVNDLECDWVVGACQEYEQALRLPPDERISVSVLCFYKAQAELIRRRLGGPAYTRFRKLDFKVVGPVDRIQGQQSDLVVISFTRARPNPGPGFGTWLQDLRRLNVACTRARRALVLVGNRETLRRLDRTGKTGAGGFYQHLFDLFDPASPHYKQIREFRRWATLR
jgi:AAA domain